MLENPSVPFNSDRYNLLRTGIPEQTSRYYQRYWTDVTKKSIFLDICIGTTEIEFTGSVFLNHSWILVDGSLQVQEKGHYFHLSSLRLLLEFLQARGFTKFRDRDRALSRSASY